MKQGVVKQYDPYKGWGFIAGEDGEDYFVNVNGLRPTERKQGLRAGQRVAFDVEFDQKGDRAVNVHAISSSRAV